MSEIDLKFIAGFFAKALCACVFMYPLMMLLFNTTTLAVRFDEWPAQVLLLFSAAIFLAILALPWLSTPQYPSITQISFWIAALVVSCPFALLKIVMGDNHIEPLLGFLAGDNFREVLTVGRGSYSQLILKSVALFAGFGLMLVFLIRQFKDMGRLVNVICVVLLLLNPITQYAVEIVIPNELHENFNLEKNYTPLVITAKPGRPKNLVMLYLESLENTFEKLPTTKAAFKPLKELRDTALYADDIHEIEGTRYTIAGIVATQCGVPLIHFGLNHVAFNHGTEYSLESFMPKVVCLGDTLANDGYTVSYMNGALLERYSKRGFLLNHGYARLFGLKSVDPTTIDGRENVFGLNDGLLFEHVADELDHLTAAGKPFFLSILTVGTHGPNGFLDRDCSRNENEVSQLAAAIRCTGTTVKRFIAALETRGLSESTLVVVLSDHLAANHRILFDQNFVQSMAADREDRRNLFFIRGLPPRKVSKTGSMIDVYPTILEALGYSIHGRRANFGVSLLSEQKTLVESYGVENANKLFLHNHKLARFLWSK